MFRAYQDTNNAYRKIEHSVLKQLIGIDLFGNNSDHEFDNDDFNNQNILLIKSVVNNYLDIKFQYKSRKIAQVPNFRNFRQRLSIHAGF
jgi:hypothetical protein